VLEVRLGIVKLVHEAIVDIFDLLLSISITFFLLLHIQLIVGQDGEVDKKRGQMINQWTNPHAIVVVFGHHVLGEDLEALRVEHLKYLVKGWLVWLRLARKDAGGLLLPLYYETEQPKRLQVSFHELRDALSFLLALELLIDGLRDLFRRLVTLQASHLCDAIHGDLLTIQVLNAARTILLLDRLTQRIRP